MKFRYPNQTLCLIISMSFAVTAASALAATPAGTVTDTLDEDQVQKAAKAYNARQMNDRSRIVCKKEAQTGTRIKKTVCRSVATMELEHEHAKRSLHQMRTFTPGRSG